MMWGMMLMKAADESVNVAEQYRDGEEEKEAVSRTEYLRPKQ